MRQTPSMMIYIGVTYINYYSLNVENTEPSGVAQPFGMKNLKIDTLVSCQKSLIMTSAGKRS